MGEGCELHLQALDTLVGFIGGIGTFVTLLIGVVMFNRENHTRALAATLDARRSPIRFKPTKYDQKTEKFMKVHIEVTNQTSRDLVNASFVLDLGQVSERELKRVHQLHSGRTFGTSFRFEDLDLEPLGGSSEVAQRLLNERLKTRVSFLFEIDGKGFTRAGDEIRNRKLPNKN